VSVFSAVAGCRARMRVGRMLSLPARLLGIQAGERFLERSPAAISVVWCWWSADVFGRADAGSYGESRDAFFADLEVADVEEAAVVAGGVLVPGAPLLHRAAGDDVEGLAVVHLAHPDDGAVELADARLVPHDRELGVEEALDLEELEGARAVLVGAALQAHHGALEAVLHELGLRLVDLFLAVHEDARYRLDGVAGLEGQAVEGFEAFRERLLEVVAVDDVVDVQHELFGEAFAVLLDEAC